MGNIYLLYMLYLSRLPDLPSVQLFDPCTCRRNIVFNAVSPLSFGCINTWLLHRLVGTVFSRTLPVGKRLKLTQFFDMVAMFRLNELLQSIEVGDAERELTVKTRILTAWWFRDINGTIKSTQKEKGNHSRKSDGIMNMSKKATTVSTLKIKHGKYISVIKVKHQFPSVRLAFFPGDGK